MSKINYITKISICLTILSLIHTSSFVGISTPVIAASHTVPVDDALLHTLDQNGQARVVVILHSPTASRGIWAQSLQIAQSQKSVLDTVPTEEFAPIHQYQVVSAMVGTVTNDGLEKLRAHPDVRLVAIDMPVQAATLESAVLMGADRVWSDFGFTGQGVNIAVVDSGIDVAHPDLNGSIVAQHCFTQANCPPHNHNEGDSATDENGHGTHIAGIIAGRGATGPQGIAPQASLIAVRALDAQGEGWTSDVVAAIDWIVANQWQHQTQIINLSLGGGQYTGHCDEADANAVMLAEVISAAHSAGMSVFAAAGNNSYTNALMSPACISKAVSVGAVYDTDLGPQKWSFCSEATTAADQIACFSNSGGTLDLLAPGGWIESLMPGGGRRGDAGTSMATAHASAVAALLLQANRNLTPVQVEQTLKAYGIPLTDTRNGTTVPRVNALAAVQAVVPPPPTPTPIPTPVPVTTIVSGNIVLQGRTNYSGVTITLDETPCNGLGMASVNNTHNTVTDANGHFTLEFETARNYQCMHIHQGHYLSGQRALNDNTMNDTTLTLPAGDVNGDGEINIFDLTRVGASYGTDDAEADLNNDGTVNIFDLTMIAGNYGKKGPITDWQQ